MEIKFVGTGSGKTSLKRFHSSFILSAGNYNLLVDAGDGVSRSLLLQKIPFNSINGILLSHLHPDHYTGLPSLVVQMKMAEREEDLHIFSHLSTNHFLMDFIYNSYLFNERLGFNIKYDAFEDNNVFQINSSLNFMPRQNSHLDSYRQYAASRRLEFSSLSFMFNADKKNIFYTGDLGDKQDLYLFFGQPVEILISEFTHLSLEEILEAFKKINPQRMYITHLSDADESKVQELIYKIPEKERKKVVIAFDGLEIKL